MSTGKLLKTVAKNLTKNEGLPIAGAEPNTTLLKIQIEFISNSRPGPILEWLSSVLKQARALAVRCRAIVPEYRIEVWDHYVGRDETLAGGMSLHFMEALCKINDSAKKEVAEEQAKILTPEDIQ